MSLVCRNCGLRTKRRPCPECGGEGFVLAEGYSGAQPIHDDDKLGGSADLEPRQTGNWLDGQARAYSAWMLWVHLLICQGPGLVVGLLFLCGCRTPEGKSTGKRLLMWSGIGVILAVLVDTLVPARPVPRP